MTDFLREYWWAIFGVGASSIYVALRIQRDGVEGSFLRRLAYALFPVLNPESSERKQITPRALWLFAIGLVIVALAIVFVPH